MVSRGGGRKRSSSAAPSVATSVLVLLVLLVSLALSSVTFLHRLATASSSLTWEEERAAAPNAATPWLAAPTASTREYARSGNGREEERPNGAAAAAEDDWWFDDAPTKANDERVLRDTWLESYFRFHASSRARFPGTALLTDPDAPGVLLRRCGGDGGNGSGGGGGGGDTPGMKNYYCGGLADRLATLPFDLFLANETGRVLLISWSMPHPLESFLVPSGDVDWTVPPAAAAEGNNKTGGDVGLEGRRLPTFNAGFDFLRKDKFKRQFRKAMDDVLASKERVYAISTPHTGSGFRYMEDKLAARLGGSTNDTATMPPARASSGLLDPPLYGAIFRRMFRPSPALRDAVEETAARAGLDLRRRRRSGSGAGSGSGSSYSAAHVRLRHPMSWGGRRVPGRDGVRIADVSGLPFSGETRDAAIDIATNAVECAINISIGGGGDRTVASESAIPFNAPEPLYLFSDSNDTVALFVDPNSSPFADDDRRIRLVSRDVSSEAMHLAYDGAPAVAAGSGSKGGVGPPPVSDFLGMFVDLLIASRARCLALDGVGGFSALARRIGGGTECAAKHRPASGWRGKKKKFFCERV